MIEKIEVDFKSTISNYNKEESGRKPNTVRKVNVNDKRFKILKDWSETQNFDLWIIISCVKFKQAFERQVKDVTYFDGYCIISWRD